MRKRIITWKRVIVCLTAIILLGFGLLVTWFWMLPPARPPEPERIEIENFVGLQVDDVLQNRTFLEEYDFVIEYEETDDYPAGFIIRQSPAAGRLVMASQDGVLRVHLHVATPELLDG